MLRAEDWAEIRRLHCAEGVPIKEIVRRLGIARNMLTELRNRGIVDVCIVCCDGLKGLPDAITATWPAAVVQTCVGACQRDERVTRVPWLAAVAICRYAARAASTVG